jgi:hypothetical protein
MKLSMLMVSAVLSTNTVIPKFADLNLHYLDRDYTASTACPAGQVQVEGLRFVEKGVNQEGLPALDERPAVKGDGTSNRTNHFCVSATELQNERDWAKSIYQTHVATGTKNQGTSFLVGNNIILTNNHIAVPIKGKPHDCRALEVLTRVGTPTWVTCKRILLCNPTQDFCFVEMNEVSAGVNLGDLSRPLTLNAKPLESQKAYLIGNSAARGIQGSKGPIDLEKSVPLAGEFAHYIPMVGGASGSPILNDRGEVLGINHAHNGSKEKFRNLVAPEGGVWNLGTSTEFIMRYVKAVAIFNPLFAHSDQYDLNQLVNLFKTR